MDLSAPFERRPLSAIAGPPLRLGTWNLATALILQKRIPWPRGTHAALSPKSPRAEWTRRRHMRYVASLTASRGGNNEVRHAPVWRVVPSSAPASKTKIASSTKRKVYDQSHEGDGLCFENRYPGSMVCTNGRTSTSSGSLPLPVAPRPSQPLQKRPESGPARLCGGSRGPAGVGCVIGHAGRGDGGRARRAVK